MRKVVIVSLVVHGIMGSTASYAQGGCRTVTNPDGSQSTDCPSQAPSAPVPSFPSQAFPSRDVPSSEGQVPSRPWPPIVSITCQTSFGFCYFQSNPMPPGQSCYCMTPGGAVPGFTR
jgi:hypothetical protein